MKNVFLFFFSLIAINAHAQIADKSFTFKLSEHDTFSISRVFENVYITESGSNINRPQYMTDINHLQITCNCKRKRETVTEIIILPYTEYFLTIRGVFNNKLWSIHSWVFHLNPIQNKVLDECELSEIKFGTDTPIFQLGVINPNVFKK